MDVRYIAWAGYELDEVIEYRSIERSTVDAEEIPETLTLQGRELKPGLKAFPDPTE